MAKKICVIGIGYIGLPTASMFAKCKYDVVGVDINEMVVNELNEGRITIEEPYLEELVKEVVLSGNLRGSTTPCFADLFIISVPTPINEKKEVNISYVESACKSILPYLRKGNIVVLESTSPIGTTSEIIKPIIESQDLKVGTDIFLGYCPERVIPGSIIKELECNDRVVGGVNEISAIKIKNIYSSFVKGKMYLTDTDTAEMCKLMENTYRDVNIALANELAKICNELDINVWDVINYCNKHPRVNIHNPGPGVGGHCLAVDPWFIVQRVPEIAELIKHSREINDSMPMYVYNKIEKILKENKAEKIITILGITYKANIDDIRESPIIKLIEILKKNEYVLKIYDPNIYEYENLYNDFIKACEGSELILLAVDHSDFSNLDFIKAKAVMKDNIILDTRNFLDCIYLEREGFKCYTI